MSQYNEPIRGGPTLSNVNLQASSNLRANQPTGRLPQHQSQLSHTGSQDQAHSNPSVLRQASKRNSVSSTVDHQSHGYSYQPQVKLENTYRLGPSDKEKFNVSRVQRLVTDILFNHLENVKYDPARCKDLSLQLSDEIKTRLKSIVHKRYKLIVNLTIGQNLGNSVIVASRSLWNTDTDNGCTVQYKNNSLYAIATIFAAYYD